MKSPDRPKRPSARPSQRPSAPPAAPDAEPQAASQPPPATVSPSEPPSGNAPRSRVSARRPSASARASSTDDGGRTALLPDPSSLASAATEGEARASSPSTAPLGVFESQAEPSQSATSAPVAEEEDDIWRDSAPFPESVRNTRAATADSTDLAREKRSGMKPATRLARGSSASEPTGEAAVIGSAKSLLSTDYYFRQYGAHGMRSMSAEVDEFGLDPHVEESARPMLEMLCKRYFRVSVEGLSHLPVQGRALMVANRSGALPWDGLVLRTAVRMQRPELPPVRWLSEDSVFHYPFLGVFMNRLGAVRACQENAERLLAQDRLVVAFPEGAQGSRKLFRDRYQLQRFGRGGYVKLALKLGAPIIPTAIIGAEETNPLLARSRVLGKLVGSEHFPITPTFPWLGPVGLLPAPVKWRILVGEPIELTNYGPDAAEDALLVHRLNDQIRGILQGLLNQGKASRRSVLFG